jgi:hypothetical protein
MRMLLLMPLLSASLAGAASPADAATCAIGDIAFPAGVAFRDLPSAPVDVHAEGDALLAFDAAGTLVESRLHKSSGRRFVDMAMADMFKQARVDRRCLSAAGNDLVVHYRTSIVQNPDKFEVTFKIDRIGTAAETARP